MKKITIIGAGISGLATAYWLNKEGHDVQVLETRNEPGGTMQTITQSGYLVDFGPNSGLETTPLISQLANEVGLGDQMIYANSEANTRYILRDNQLHALPMSLIPFLMTKLFSPNGKLRLLAEPFIASSKDGYYQSIAEFVERRLGREFLDFAIDPFVSGVYAGDPNKLSVKSAFPKLYFLEEAYGGLIKGMILGMRERKKRKEISKQSARMFSFKNGMQSFPEAIANKLGNKIKYGVTVGKIDKIANKFRVLVKEHGMPDEFITDRVISTIPAYTIAPAIKNIDSEIAEHLNGIYYPPVLVLYLGFKKKNIGRHLDGFGYLIPSKENKSYLGAIWSSTIFPNRSADENASFTLFIGGARASHLFEGDRNQLLRDVVDEFKCIMNVTGDPEFMIDKIWNKAIPQYNVGYIEHEKYFNKFEKENPGIILSGNFRGGISVGDCIKNSKIVADKIIL